MAKTSAVEKNKRRRKLVANHAAKRAVLKAIIMNQSLPIEERFKATLKLAELPAMGPRPASAIVAKSPVVRVPIIASCACRVLHFANWAISARCRAWSSRAGKETGTWQ